VGPRSSLDGCGKSRPTGIRAPDRLTRSDSLYGLSNPGPGTHTVQIRTQEIKCEDSCCYIEIIQLRIILFLFHIQCSDFFNP